MKRLVIGISGASGVPIAVEVLRALKGNPEWASCLVISKGGERTIESDCPENIAQIRDLADTYYDIRDIGASIASGTFRTEGMVVVPCSMKTAAGIACGYSDNLLLRAADVTLKERRKLVLVARETPLNTIHLRNLLELSQAGAIIMPPMLTFYNNPQTLQDAVNHVAGKILDVFQIEYDKFRRWNPDAIHICDN